MEAEGLELMVLILKQRQQVRFGALKAVVSTCLLSLQRPYCPFVWQAPSLQSMRIVP